MKRFDDETGSGREFTFQAANVNHTTNTMLKIKSKLFAWVLTVGSLAITAAGAHAQNANYAPGDLVMFFQQYGGSQTVYANLGSATTWRGAATGADVANSLNFLNINTQLTSAFGASWATDTTLFAGMAGVYSTSTSNSELNSGDPTRTLYLSKSRSAEGTLGSANSSALSLNTNGAFTTVASSIEAMNNVLETTYSTAVAVSPVGTSQIDDKNPFLNSTTQGAAFNNSVSGGVQQTGSASSFGAFGPVSGAEFVLDLYRLQPYGNISGQVGFGLAARASTYEGSFALDGNGDISFVSSAAVPEPSTYAMCGIAAVAAGIFAYRRRKLSNTVQK